MPYRRLPNSISSVLRTLNVAAAAWTEYPTARLITEAHWAKLDPANPESLRSRFTKEAGDVALALAAQAPLTDALSRGTARLTLYVSHFHQVYDLAVARGQFSAGGRAFYGRDVANAIVPDLSSIPALLENAAKIGPGEAARATAEGTHYTPMALPSAAEVAALHAEVATARSVSLQAQAKTDQEQNEVGLLYPEAQKLAVSICNTVEFQLAETELDAPGQRRIARRWGVVYIYESSETPDPDDQQPVTLDAPSAPLSTPSGRV